MFSRIRHGDYIFCWFLASLSHVFGFTEGGRVILDDVLTGCLTGTAHSAWSRARLTSRALFHKGNKTSSLTSANSTSTTTAFEAPAKPPPSTSLPQPSNIFQHGMQSFCPLLSFFYFIFIHPLQPTLIASIQRTWKQAFDLSGLKLTQPPSYNTSSLAEISTMRKTWSPATTHATGASTNSSVATPSS